MRSLAIALLLATSVSAEPLRTIHVTNDRAPDCSSLEALFKSVTRDCRTDDAKLIAVYNACRYIYYHHAYPTEKSGVSALKMINVYGWGLCGGQHSVLAAIWAANGYKWRYMGWRGHTTVEVYYGGRWHYFDTFLKFYCWMPDAASPGGRTVAGQMDIKANPALVNDGFVMDGERRVCYHKNNRFDFVGDKVNWTAPAFMVCGDTLPGVVSGVQGARNAGSGRGWASVRFDGDYTPSVDLAPGYALTLGWSKVEDGWFFRGRKQGPHHTCGDKDYRNCPAIGPLLEPYRELGRARTWSNGTLVYKPDLSGGPLAPGAHVIPMASPYVVAKASAKITCDDARVEVSLDGKTWKPATLPDLTPLVRGAYSYQVRVTARKPVTAVEIESLVQHNQEALPYLAPGENHITITAANPDALGKNRLAVTYAYCLGSRDRTPEEVHERGAEIARAHYATWSDKPIVVQTVVDKLPATLDIPIPTPKGRQPVYPRMVYLRREVLAPGQKPMPTPAPPTTPSVGPDQTLATLPNPWTIGTTPPATAADRPTTTTVLPVRRVGYCSKKGEVFPHQFIKWLKDNSDAWIMLVDFDASKLPDPKTLASAKLVVFVHESHNRAPMQAAAVMLDAPFDPKKPFDFAKLGRTLGTAIVAQGNGPGDPFVPPRPYAIDVTRAVRGWARGEPNRGLAVRIVPNRSVDDGWTVRFTPNKQKPAELQLNTFKK